MDIDTIITEKPYFKLTKEYPEGQLKIEDLSGFNRQNYEYLFSRLYII